MEEQSHFCNRCKDEKPFSNFSKHPCGKNGLQARCKECVNMGKRERHAANPEKRNSQWRDRYNSNKGKYRAIALKSYKRYRGERLITSKAWRENNKEKLKEYRFFYKERMRLWLVKNKHRLLTYGQKTRAKREAALHPEHNTEMEFTLDEMRIRVQNCLGIKFEKDHILPIGKGGPHHHLNLQIIPKSLNRKKSSNLNYKHPLLIHWTELPASLMNWIK